MEEKVLWKNTLFRPWLTLVKKGNDLFLCFTLKSGEQQVWCLDVQTTTNLVNVLEKSLNAKYALPYFVKKNDEAAIAVYAEVVFGGMTYFVLGSGNNIDAGKLTRSMTTHRSRISKLSRILREHSV